MVQMRNRRPAPVDDQGRAEEDPDLAEHGGQEEQRLAPAPQVHSDDDDEDQPNSDHGVGLSGEGQPVRDRVPRRAAMGGEESID
jgi:hypothetical protein